MQGNRISLCIVALSGLNIFRGEWIEQQASSQIVELVFEDGLLVACSCSVQIKNRVKQW
jgi:hypothetical protein